jgi:hypothetical protein
VASDAVSTRTLGFTGGITTWAGGPKKGCWPVHNEITETWNTGESGVL